MNSTDTDRQIRCPTCRATQIPADTCRRCRSDLRLLVSTLEWYAWCRTQCWEALDRGNPVVARQWAEQCLAMRACEESLRLAAIAALRAGDFAAAARFALEHDARV